MASIFARDLAGLTSAEIAQQQADTQQRAVDLAYLAQIANAGVTRAGDMGRERVGMRTTDNSRDVGMRSADVTDRGLTLRRESDLEQRGVDMYRIDSEGERARNENLNRLAIAIKQAEMQQAATAAANAQRNAEIKLRGDEEAKAAAIRAAATSDAGQVDPRLFDMLLTIEATKRDEEKALADEEAVKLSQTPSWTRMITGWAPGIDDRTEAREAMIQKFLDENPSATNRFSFSKSPSGETLVKRKPQAPLDVERITEQARRPMMPGAAPARPVAPSGGIDLTEINRILSGTNAPAGTNQPTSSIPGTNLTVLSDGYIKVWDTNGVPSKVLQSKLQSALKKGWSTFNPKP